MRVSKEDEDVLISLCVEYRIDPEKVKQLLVTVQDYELKDKRFGIYDALEEIIKQKGGMANGEE